VTLLAWFPFFMKRDTSCLVSLLHEKGHFLLCFPFSPKLGILVQFCSFGKSINTSLDRFQVKHVAACVAFPFLCKRTTTYNYYSLFLDKSQAFIIFPLLVSCIDFNFLLLKYNLFSQSPPACIHSLCFIQFGV